MSTNRKTIAFLIHGLNSGGAERVLSTLANALAKEFNIVIITQKKTAVFYTLDPSIEVVHCFEHLPPSKNPLQALKTNVILGRKVWRLLKRHRASLCIAFITTSNIIAVLTGRFLGIPVIISERNYPVLEDRKISGFWKKLKRYAYPRASALVVQTQEIKSFFMPEVAEDNIRIIPNPLNPDFGKLDLKMKRDPIILNVGRLDAQKGQEVLINAFKGLKAPDWKLVILGEGPERTRLEAQIEQLGLQDRVMLPGRSSEVAKWFGKSSIFGFSSRYEGFPNALMEAMHFGLACVSSDCPTGPSELIESGQNGFLFRVDDVKELEQRLQQLIEDPLLRERMGLAAQHTMEAYSSDRITAKWRKLIEDVTGF